MIRTPSLRGRMVLVGITALALVTSALDTFVFLSLRDRLEESLVDVLDAREQIARRLGNGVDGRALAEELADAGVPAVVRDRDGAVYLSDPAGQSFGVVPPGDEDSADVERRLVEVGEGMTVEVQVGRGGADRTLQRLLYIEIVGTVAVLLLALVVLRRVSALVTRPVERIVQVADAIAAGQTGVRLDPSDPSTELGRMALAFDRTVDAMEEALEEARDAQASSRRFLSDAAHQLRTPLAGLRASAESLLRDPEAADRDAMLANIARESVRASRLVDALLRVARLERGEPLSFTEVDVAAIVVEERERATALAPDIDVRFEAVGEDFVVAADRRVLKDAVANLLDNARQHARSRITVTLVEEHGALRLVVDDDGPGVPEGEEERVFERFVSLDGRGSGLGLPIARGVARSHGGDLTVQGSRFEMLLPRTSV